MINLAPLFTAQEALGAHIAAEHPPQEGEDRLGKLILSLNVEVGELANELPEVFKFWSRKKNDMDKALGEYVDALHFILSIGNHIGHAKAWIAIWGDDVDSIKEFDIVCQFNTVFTLVGEFFKDQSAFDYCVLVKAFLGLGEMLGFTDEQIVEAYHAKNRENHARQERGY